MSAIARRPGRVLLAAVAISAGGASVASAHMMTTGLGPFYDGLAHLILTVEDVLPVIALALFAGLRGPRSGRAVLFTLPLAWILGCAAGRLLHAGSILPAVAAALTLACGALAAADRALPVPAVAAVAALLGLWNGAWNGTELPALTGAAIGNVLGAACAVFVLVALAAGLASTRRAPWSRIAVRVAGSWIAAAGLLMLGWSLRKA